MGLADVTDRAAVLAAMAEYDRLGEEAFLGAHGFGRAREYVLVHEGRRYDSKAIVGVAHGIQHGTVLPAAAFRGGPAGAVKRLRALGFVVEGPDVRNPAWKRDELLLALDVYFRHAPRLPGTGHPDVVDLSGVLRRYAARPVPDSFRNANSVRLKLANFGAHDPTYTGGPAPNGGALTREVWTDWHDRPADLAAVAAGIRAEVAAGRVVPAAPDDEDDDDGAPEGRTLHRLHQTRERSSTLRLRKITAAMANHGRLECEACGAHLPDVYGDVASGVVEVHHVVWLAHGGARTVRLADLAILCPNCHRVIHRTPGMLPTDLRRLVEARRGPR